MAKKKKSHLSLVPLWIAITGIALLILFGAYQYYNYEKQQIEEEKYSDLKAISDLKANQILQWMEERMSEVRFFSGNPNFAEYTNHLLQGREDMKPAEYLREQLTHIQKTHAYENLFITSPSGEVIFQMNNTYPYTDDNLRDAINAVFDGDLLEHTGFYLSSDDQHIHIDIVAPVKMQGEVLAALVFRINPETYLYPLLQDWPTASKSSETLIVRDEGDSVLFLNELRHRHNTALQLKVAKSDTSIPAVAAVNGYTGIFDGYDYRGVRVLSYVRPIEGWPWYMVAKVDKSELLSELSFKTTAIIVVLAILFLLVAAAVAWIYSRKQKEIYRGLYLKEKELWESQEEFKTILYSIGDAVVTTDINGIISQMNPAAEELTGWKEEEATGIEYQQIIHIRQENGKPVKENLVKEVLNRKKASGLENHSILISKDGRQIPVADSAAPIRNNENKITGVVLVFRDQSREYEAKKRIRESEGKYRLIAEKASDVIWTYDLKKKRYTYVSPSIKNIFGFTPEEASSMDIQDHIPEEYKEKVREITSKVAEKNEQLMAPLVIELEQLKKNGGKVWTSVSLTVLYDDNNEPFILHGITRDITERKLAEQALARSEEKYRFLTENSVDVVWQTDLRLKFIYVSPSIRQLLGYSQEEMIGTHVWAHTNWKEFARMSRKIVESINDYKRRKVTVIEGKMKCKNGQERWVEVVSKPLVDKSGKLIGLQGTTRDISERIEAEKKLREKEELLYRSQEIAKIGSWEYFIPDKRLIWSDEVYRIFGLDQDEFKPAYETFLQRIHPDDREEVDNAYKSSIENNENGYAIEHRIVQRNTGEIRYVYEKCEHIRDEDGNIMRSVGMVQDITERKVSEKALRRSESRFRNLFENAPVGIFKTNSAGTIYEMNPTMARMLDCKSVKEAIKHYHDLGSQLYADPKMREKFVEMLNRDGFVENFEYEAKTKTDRRIHLSMSARISEMKMDGTFTIEGFTSDISSQKEAAKKLVQQNKEYQMLNEEYISQNNELNQSIELIRRVNQDLEIAREKAEESDRLKTSFLANMSHEIRTPMNAIIGFSNFLNDNISDEERKRFINIIQTNANHLLKIIDDVINISRLESEKIVPEQNTFYLKKLLEEIYQSFLPDFENKAIKLEYSLPEDLAEVMIEGDYQKIHQIITGFINNSLKYTNKGKITFGCERIDGQIRFYVTDTGIGIPEDEQEKVFERFFRGRQVQKKAIGGTGLGLSIARYLTRLIQGKIELQSQEGEGSTFAIILPFVQAEKSHENIAMPEADTNVMKELNVLIVEDEPANQEYIDILISNTVKNTATVSNGKEAIEKLRKEQFDLILMDIKMPEMDGLEATKKIRNTNPDVIIIAQTAYSQPEEVHRALEAGCNDYLIKPLRRTDLFRVIGKYFGNRNIG